MIYFTSDLHLNHTNIIKYSNRPFQDVQEMNEILVLNWNKLITSVDEVYVLGDIGMGNPSNYIKRMNGTKYLVAGNHDKKNLKNQEFTSLWNWVKDYYELKLDGQLIVMCHYPFASWNGMHRNSICLHGHCHGSMEKSLPWITTGGKIMDVGVDVHGYCPISLNVVNSYMSKKTFQVVDHHQPHGD